MPPSAAQSQAVLQLRGLIWHSLDNGMIETALFSAERLYAYDTKNADSVHLFGLCLVRDAQYRQAEDLTKSSLKHVGCAYVYAQCCLKLVGGREQQGVNALEACKRLWGTNTQWSESSYPLDWELQWPALFDGGK
jgi:anaphase-promoting complex subunit 3